MAFASVTLKDRDVQQGLRRMLRKGKDLRPMFRRLRGPLRRDLREHAAEERGPDGKWPPRVRSNKRPLLGNLPKSTTVRQRGQGMIAMNPAHFSGVLDEGGRVGRGAVIPARPFVFFSERFLDTVEERVLDFVVGGGWER